MTEPEQPRLLSMNALIIYGFLALIAWGISEIVFDRSIIVFRPDHWPIQQTVLLGVSVGLILVLISRFLNRFSWSQTLEKELAKIIGHQSELDAGILASSSAIGEEFLFRGLLLPLLGPPFLGLILSSLLFGAAHQGPSKAFRPWTIMATVVGFIFGGISLWTGDIIAAIIAHMTVNYFNFLHLVAKEKVLE